MSNLTQTSVIALTLLVSCTADLAVPDGVMLSCSSDADCPSDFVCRGTSGQCAPAGNGPPSLSIGSIARHTGDVPVQITLSDPEKQSVTLGAQWRQGEAGIFEDAPLSQTTFETTTEPTVFATTWITPPGLDDSSYHPALYLQLTARDSGGGLTEVLSAPFAWGNAAPVLDSVAVDVPGSGTVTGFAVVRFAVFDSSSDFVTVTAFEVSRDGSFTDAVAVDLNTGLGGNFPSGSLTGLISDPVTPVGHSLTWDTAMVLSGEALTDVRVRLTVEDDFDGAVTLASPAFPVDNTINLAPTVGIETVVGNAGDVLVDYTVTDAESDPIDLIVEYLTLSGEWAAATEGSGGDGSTSLTTTPSGTPYSYVWDSITDGMGLSAVDDRVQLRLAARDGSVGAFATTAPFTLDNTSSNAEPSVEVVTPGGTVSGRTVLINFLLTDTEGDPCDIAVEVQRADGTWVPAAAGIGGDGTAELTSAPGTGVLHTFVWDSAAPEESGGIPVVSPTGQWIPTANSIGITSRADVLLQIRPEQTPPEPVKVGAWAQTQTTFTVDNGLLLNAPPTVVVGSLPDRVPAGQVMLHFDLIDNEGNPTDVTALEYSTDGNAWLPATILSTLGDGPVGLASSATGNPTVLAWDVGSDTFGFEVSQHALLRLTVADDYHETTVVVPQTIVVPKLVSMGNVTEAPNSPGEADATFDLQGNIHVVWGDAATSNTDVMYRASFDGGISWSATTSFSADAWITNGLCTGGSTSTSSYRPQIAIDSLGVLHIIWFESVGSRRLWAVRSTDGGASWSCPTDISQTQTPSFNPMVMGVAARDRIAAMLRTDTDLYVVTSTDNGENWSNPPMLVEAATVSAAGVALGPDASIHFVWSAGGTLGYARSDDGGQIFSPVSSPSTSVTVNSVDVDVDDRGIIHVMWGDNASQNTSYARSIDQGATWTDERGFDVGSHRLELASDGAGSLYGSWSIEDPPNGSIYAIYTTVSNDSGKTWSKPTNHQLVTGKTARVFGLAVSTDEIGIVWTRLDPSPQEILFASTRRAFRLWPTRSLVPGNDAPLLAADGERAIGIYRQPGGSIALLASTSSDGGISWTEPAVFVPGPEYKHSVVVAMNGDTVHVIWRENPNAQFHIVSMDRGQTWGAATVIATTGIGNFAKLVVDATGTAHVIGNDGGSTGSLVYTYSTDEGASWSPFTTIDSGSYGAIRPVVLGNGDLHFSTYETASLWHFDSTDGGNSWNGPNPIVSGSVSGECALAADPDGGLYSVWKGTDDVAYVSWSNDGGSTWSPATAVSTHPDRHRNPAIAATPSGELFVTFLGDSQHTQFLSTSADRGKTWTTSVPVFRAPAVYLADDVGLLSTFSGQPFFTQVEPYVGASISRLSDRADFIETPPGTSTIPDDDAAGVVSTLGLSGNRILEDVRIMVDIRHPDRGELEVTLDYEPPGGLGSGISIDLHDRGEAGGFDLTRLYADDAPSGALIANGTMNQLRGASLDGTWTLTVADRVPGNTGQLVRWGLSVR